MKHLTEMEIESGSERIRTKILNEVSEEERVERWIRNFLIHPFTNREEETLLTIPVPKQVSEDD
jgi:hypothetical protein